MKSGEHMAGQSVTGLVLKLSRSSGLTICPKRAAVSWTYRVVLQIDACPSNTWSVPASSRCVAKLCRSVCGDTCFFNPAAWTAFFNALLTAARVMVGPLAPLRLGNR